MSQLQQALQQVTERSKWREKKNAVTSTIALLHVLVLLREQNLENLVAEREKRIIDGTRPPRHRKQLHQLQICVIVHISISFPNKT
jgi:hypothetical protein